MSLNYIVSSPLVIDGTTLSELSLNIGGDSINIVTSSSLSSTYNFVLPPNIGSQNQILTLNSSLETEWKTNSASGSIQFFSLNDTTTFALLVVLF